MVVSARAHEQRWRLSRRGSISTTEQVSIFHAGGDSLDKVCHSPLLVRFAQRAGMNLEKSLHSTLGVLIG